MEISELKTYSAPNIFSIREPVVLMQVKLGELADTPTKDIGNLNDKLIDLFPGIKEHKCSTGYVGGFVDRLREGTYLAHVMEHLCLEIQGILGYDIKYGKTRQVKDDIYNIIFSCGNPTIGKACANFILNAMNDLTEGKNVDIDNELEKIRKIYARYDLGVSTGAIIAEAKKREIPVSLVNDGELVRLGYGKYQKLVSATLCESTSGISVDCACNKQLTKTLLQEVDIPVPEGIAVYSIEEAVYEADQIGYPVVVKPKNGNKGKFVYVNVKNAYELRDAYKQASAFDGEVIIEKFIKGRDYRVLVVNGQMVAAAERIPANIAGDGRHSIKELISIENQNCNRGEDHEKPLTKIKVDENIQTYLNKQGISLDYIPHLNEVLYLRGNANLSTGGQAVDCTDMVHVENKVLFEEAARTIGLDIAGIDVITPDITRPLKVYKGAIVEINAAPGIRMHLNPTHGKKRDVASPILDMIFPSGNQFTIPIISVTGTNGKTATTRLISKIFRHMGFNVGTNSAHGIYVNGSRIEEGDSTGAKGAKRVLNNREVEAAVLETSRSGIIKEGLAYEKADIAVFTNLTGAHLGMDDVNTMEQLLHVKSLVIEAVKPDGVCVLNADDPWVKKASEKAGGRKLFFSLNDNNPFILEHIKSGGMAIYKDNDNIKIVDSCNVIRKIGIDVIPETHAYDHTLNIYNNMAAIAVGYAMGFPLIKIEEAIRLDGRIYT